MRSPEADDFIQSFELDLRSVAEGVASLPPQVFAPHTWYSPTDGYTELSSTSLSTILPVDHPLSGLLFEKTKEALELYMAVAPNPHLFTIVKSHSGKINKYGVGNSMELHVDHIRDLTPNTDGVPILTLLFQLAGDYEGGELKVRDRVFPSGTDKVIMFPSNMLFPHEVCPVTKGERISATVWGW